MKILKGYLMKCGLRIFAAALLLVFVGCRTTSNPEAQIKDAESLDDPLFGTWTLVKDDDQQLIADQTSDTSCVVLYELLVDQSYKIQLSASRFLSPSCTEILPNVKETFQLTTPPRLDGCYGGNNELTYLDSPSTGQGIRDLFVDYSRDGGNCGRDRVILTVSDDRQKLRLSSFHWQYWCHDMVIRAGRPFAEASNIDVFQRRMIPLGTTYEAATLVKSGQRYSFRFQSGDFNLTLTDSGTGVLEDVEADLRKNCTFSHWSPLP